MQNAQHRRRERLTKMRDFGIVAVGRHHILNEIVGTNTHEFDGWQHRVEKDRGGRNFEHHAQRHPVVRFSLGVELSGRFANEAAQLS